MRAFRASAALFALIAIPLGAQSASLRGLVLTDSTERPIAGVVVSIELLKLSVTTDSLGRFALNGIPAGAHVVSVRRIGFGPIDTRVSFTAGANLEADLMLLPANVQTLPGVKVETKAPVRGKLAEFEERRLGGGGGRFLTRADLEKRPFSTLTDALRQMPGIEFLRDRDRAYEYYAVAGRMSQPAGAMTTGKLQPCFAAVILDGIMVYGAGESNEPKFNIGNINPTTLAGIEFYVGPASMPIKYNAMRHTCGLLVLWTK